MSVLARQSNEYGEVQWLDDKGAQIALVQWRKDGHQRGDWLAWTPPVDWRDSGMKRFKTQRGAEAWATRRLATTP